MLNGHPYNPDNQVLVLGISPGFAGSIEKSKSVQRVWRWMAECGIDPQEFNWLNLSEEPGTNPKLSEITLKRSDVANYEKVICLGNKPAQWCKSLHIDHVKMVPHPSGMNRIWNNPEVEPLVIEDLKTYMNYGN